MFRRQAPLFQSASAQRTGVSSVRPAQTGWTLEAVSNLTGAVRISELMGRRCWALGPVGRRTDVAEMLEQEQLGRKHRRSQSLW